MSRYRVEWVERHSAYVDFDRLAADFDSEWQQAKDDGHDERDFLVETMCEMGEDFFYRAEGVSSIIHDSEADVTLLREAAEAAS